MKMYLCTALIVFAFCSAAQANGYIGIYGGASFYETAEVSNDYGYSSDIEFDDMGYSAAIAFGLNFSKSLRGELETGYQKCGIDTPSVPGYSFNGDATITSLIADFYFDFLPHGPLSPFVFGGTGMAVVEMSTTYSSYDDTVPVFNLGVGISASVEDNATVEFKYRYFGMEEPEINGRKVDLATHSFMLGVRVFF